MTSSKVRLTRLYAYAFALVSGYAVMHLELCAFRVLNFNFGVGDRVTGVLLAIVMLALAGGYYVGGTLSRRGHGINILSYVMLCAGFWIACTNLIFSGEILDWAHRSGGTLGGVAAISCILYAAPMWLLAQTCPHLIKLVARDGESGHAAGALLAISTFGSLAGTLLASLFFIPELGLQSTLRILVYGLLVLALTGIVIEPNRLGRLAIATAATVVFGLTYTSDPNNHQADVILEKHTPYSQILVRKQLDGQNETIFRLETRAQGMALESIFNPGRPLKSLFTLQLVSPPVLAGARRVLLIGAGLGQAVVALRRVDPTIEVTAVDLDPEVVELAQAFSQRGGVSPNDVEWIAADGRQFLARSGARVWDAIIVDVFRGRWRPPQFLTSEFYAIARSHLTERGVLVVNPLWPRRFMTKFDEAVDHPIFHVMASMRSAGFETIGMTDTIRLGLIVAVPYQIDFERWRDAAASYALNPTHLTETRMAALLTAYFGLLKVPDRPVRPFTDDWVPLLDDALWNERYDDVVVQASQTRAWSKEIEGGDLDNLRVVAAKYYARAITRDQSVSAYLLGSGGGSYCADLRTWINRSTQQIPRQIAESLFFDSAAACPLFRTPEAPELTLRERGLAHFLFGFRAAEQVFGDNLPRRDTAPEALEHLLAAVRMLSSSSSLGNSPI